MQLIWAGWCLEGGSDKIWGILQTDTNVYYNFWCKRSAKLQFKRTNTIKYHHKLDRGYRTITLERLESIYPDFLETARQQLIVSVLSDTVR